MIGYRHSHHHGDTFTCAAAVDRDRHSCLAWADIDDPQPRAHGNRYRRTLGIVVSSLFKFALAIL
jgi:hypothetical protein